MTDPTPLPISSLPAATSLDGSELVPVVQDGVTKRAVSALFMEEDTDTHAVTAGAIEIRRLNFQDYATPPSLTAGLYPFPTLGVSFTDYSWRQNTNNTTILDIVTGNIYINFPCLVEFTTAVNGDADFTTDDIHITAVMSRSTADDVYGQSVIFPTGGAFTTTGVSFSGTTGPLRCPSAESWNTVLLLESAQAGNVFALTQAMITAKVVAVLGRVLTFARANAGSGYAVDDIISINNGYVACTLRVATLTGGGGADTLTLVSGGLGYTVTTSPTTAVTGAGVGCTIDILSVDF